MVPHNVSLLGSNVNSCLGSIERYMLDDPQSFVPNAKTFEQLSSEITDQVSRGVRSILRRATACRGVVDDTDDTDELQQFSANDYDKPPRLGRSLDSASFLEVCRKIFGGQTIDEVYKNSSKSAIRMEDFLIAFVGATIYDWVLESRHRPLPVPLKDSSKLSLYEKEIRQSEYLPKTGGYLLTMLPLMSNVVHPRLHEQVSLRIHRVLVNEVTEYDNFVPALCRRLRDTLLQFLVENDFRTTDRDGSCFSDIFKDVYFTALRFRGQVMLKEQLCVCIYVWPCGGDIFDGGKMTTRRRVRNSSDFDGKKVALPLLPGLIIFRLDAATSGSSQEAAIPATVLLE